MPEEELLTFFKALSDANRLKIIGLLARRPHSGEELAAILNLRPSTISHHLAKLALAGLVSAKTESYYNVYRLESQALESLSQRLLSQDALPAAASEVDLTAYDRKVVADYSLPDGRLKTIPAQRRKLDVILRHIGQAFQPGEHYTEKQVNEILARYHSDVASLRRELISARLLSRRPGGEEYWRTEE